MPDFPTTLVFRDHRWTGFFDGFEDPGTQTIQVVFRRANGVESAGTVRYLSDLGTAIPAVVVAGTDSLRSYTRRVTLTV